LPQGGHAVRPPPIPASAVYFAKLHWRLRDRLPMWVVYDKYTREYPGVFVARMHVTLPEPKATRFVMTHDTLDELRAIIPASCVSIGRYPEDVPEIIEVWI
jgi:hypothetical protein